MENLCRGVAVIDFGDMVSKSHGATIFFIGAPISVQLTSEVPPTAGVDKEGV